VDRGMAEKLGYNRPILQGLAFLGIGSRAVLSTFTGSNPVAFRAVNARFSKVVLSGQALETQMWLEADTRKNGARRVLFRMKCVETGDLVLTNAFMDLEAALVTPPVLSSRL